MKKRQKSKKRKKRKTRKTRSKKRYKKKSKKKYKKQHKKLIFTKKEVFRGTIEKIIQVTEKEKILKTLAYIHIENNSSPYTHPNFRSKQYIFYEIPLYLPHAKERFSVGKKVAIFINSGTVKNVKMRESREEIKEIKETEEKMREEKKYLYSSQKISQNKNIQFVFFLTLILSFIAGLFAGIQLFLQNRNSNKK